MRHTLGQAWLAPVTPMVNAGSQVFMLALATRQDQWTDIASYMLGASIAALVAVVTSGGTTFRYLTASTSDKQRIKFARLYVSTPALLLVAISFACAAGQSDNVALPATILGVGTVAVTTVGEMPTADLQRQGQLATLTASITASKGLGILLLITETISFAWAMSLSAFVHVLIVAVLADVRQFSVRSTANNPFAKDGRVFSRDLFQIAFFMRLTLRLPYLVIPYAVNDAAAAGALIALLSSTQGVIAIFTSSLYTVMALRTSQQGRSSQADALERLLHYGALFAGICLLVFPPLLLVPLGLPASSPYSLWTVALALAIPAVVLNRELHFRLMSRDRQEEAKSRLRVIACLTAIFLGLGAATGSTVAVAGAIAIAEFTAGFGQRLIRGKAK